MLESLKHIDTDLFLYLNSKHTAFFDVLMFWISNEFVWIPFYIFLLFLVYKKYSKQTILVVVLVAALITLSDQLSVHLFKNVFFRYRPCHNLNIQSIVHLVNNHCGGQYGFISSHAANTFALASYLSIIMKGTYKNFAWLIILWAAIVSYSRIYLGVHYPADVICGAAFGSILGIFIGKLFFTAQAKFYNNQFTK